MCTEEGCQDLLYSKGICQRHYNRLMGKKYRDRQKELNNLEIPPEALRKEYYDGLWQFVKKELRIKC